MRESSYAYNNKLRVNGIKLLYLYQHWGNVLKLTASPIFVKKIKTAVILAAETSLRYNLRRNESERNFPVVGNEGGSAMGLSSAVGSWALVWCEEGSDPFLLVGQ